MAHNMNLITEHYSEVFMEAADLETSFMVFCLGVNVALWFRGELFLNTEERLIIFVSENVEYILDMDDVVEIVDGWIPELREFFHTNFPTQLGFNLVMEDEKSIVVNTKDHKRYTFYFDGMGECRYFKRLLTAFWRFVNDLD